MLLRIALLTLILPSLAFSAEPPFQLPARAELLKFKSALIKTNKGDLLFELYPEDAPWHVANFKYLADKGFYKNLPFHLFEVNYFIQAGAPPGNPNGGPGYSLPPEFSARKHTRGTLGMARNPNELNKERRSNGSQFHIMLGESPHLDGTYTIFGRMTKGDAVLDSLELGDRIIEVKVFIVK